MVDMLDKSKHYGETFGANCKYRYVQDGKYYLSNGTEVNTSGAPVKKKRTKKQ